MYFSKHKTHPWGTLNDDFFPVCVPKNHMGSITTHITTHFDIVDSQIRQDVEHILLVISENHKALSNVVAVLTSLQDEVHILRETVRRQQSTTFQIHAPALTAGGHAPTPSSPGWQASGASVHASGKASTGSGRKRSQDGRRESVFRS